VARENPSLYYEIQALNDYGGDALAALGAAVERLRAAVGARDEAAFRTLMARGRDYLAERSAGEPGA
jgi:chorismate mutase/prephenate dehydrogenase